MCVGLNSIKSPQKSLKGFDGNQSMLLIKNTVLCLRMHFNLMVFSGLGLRLKGLQLLLHSSVYFGGRDEDFCPRLWKIYE